MYTHKRACPKYLYGRNFVWELCTLNYNEIDIGLDIEDISNFPILFSSKKNSKF